MRTSALLIGTFAALIAVPALAQNNANANAVRINGTVNSMTADAITVKTDDGKSETLKMGPMVLYLQNVKATAKDIKAGDYVASAAVKGTDGKLHSTELRIFPEAMRGAGEGQRPMNDANNQTMTNATVTGVAMIGESGDIKVKLPNMESELVVDPGVPVTKISAIDKGLVKAGSKVLVQGTKAADGSETATRVTLQ